MSADKTSKNCYWASHGIALYDDLTFRPCCRYRKLSSEELPDSRQMSMDDAFQSPLFNNVRESLAQGVFPEACSICEIEENNGLKSLRLNTKKIPHDNKTLESIEIFIGSLCNMKCRMCDAQASSQWARELKQKTSVKVNIKQVLEKLKLDELKRLRLLGGETLIHPNFFEITQYIHEKDKAAQVELSFATNGSVGPTPEIVQALNGFKRVDICFSIDGIDAVAEYIRYGVSWSKISRNIKEWIEFKKKSALEITFNAHTTLQAANYNDIENILVFCIENNLSWSQRTLDYPRPLRIQHLPQVIRKEIARKLIQGQNTDAIINYFISRNRYDLWLYLTQTIPNFIEDPIEPFLAELKDKDQRWAVSWKNGLNELNRLLDNEKLNHKNHKFL